MTAPRADRATDNSTAQFRNTNTRGYVRTSSWSVHRSDCRCRRCELSRIDGAALLAAITGKADDSGT